MPPVAKSGIPARKPLGKANMNIPAAECVKPAGIKAIGGGENRLGLAQKRSKVSPSKNLAVRKRAAFGDLTNVCYSSMLFA